MANETARAGQNPAVGPADDDPTTESLRIEQVRREDDERARAEQASTGPERRSAQRRADKAAYLREKLDEQAEHPDGD